MAIREYSDFVSLTKANRGALRSALRAFKTVGFRTGPPELSTMLATKAYIASHVRFALALGFDLSLPSEHAPCSWEGIQVAPE